MLWRWAAGRCRGSQAPSIAAGELSKERRKSRSTSSVPPAPAHNLPQPRLHTLGQPGCRAPTADLVCVQQESKWNSLRYVCACRSKYRHQDEHSK